MPPEENGQDSPQQSNGAGSTPDLSTLPDWAQELIRKQDETIREVNSEAKQRRLALEAKDEQFRLAEQKRLAEAGEFRTLAEQRAAEVEKLKPYQTRAEQLETLIADGNKKRVEQISEPMRKLVPPLPPEQLASWLDANWDVLTARSAPQTDAGAGSSGGGKKPPQLTPEQKAMADAMGVSHENYAKQLAALQAERGRNED